DYDYLVVALGQRTADYGIPGVLDHGLTLRSLEDAYAIRNAAKRIVTKGGGRVVVGGAGLSGVQVAGELVDLFEKRGLSLGDYSVKLVEALEDVMPNQDPDLRAEVERLLRSKGVVTETGNPVREVTEDSVDLDTGGSVPYDLFVWTGGLTSHGFEVRPEHERRKRDAFAVRPTLESVDHDGVFFVGDAGYTEVDGIQVPATAWAAYDEGETAARNIVRSIEDEPLHRFELDDPGTLVSVGREAVGKVGGRVVTGKAAEQLKKGAAVRHITRVAGPRRGAESFFADL
ncbi:MAG: FAD-dependent oxidoreductase, partial [Halobacteria archaeon]|nr:FAD-dependent oxidoreductase [Halobacteria archaeon]